MGCEGELEKSINLYLFEGECISSPLEKILVANYFPCVDVENYVPYCEQLNLTYFPSLSSKKYFLFVSSLR